MMRETRPWVMVLVVVAAGALVAVGARGVGVFLTPGEMDEGLARAVRVGGIVAALLGLGWLLLERRRAAARSRREPDPAAAALLTAFKLMAVVALLALLVARGGLDDGGEPGENSGGGEPEMSADAPRTGEPPPLPDDADMAQGFDPDEGVADPSQRVPPMPDSLPDEERSLLDWLTLSEMGSLLLLLLVVAAVVVAVLVLARRRGTEAPPIPPEEPPVSAADAEAGLVASLDEMAVQGSDPRSRITAAYLRLLSALIDAGAPPRPEEAPHEHLYRTLGPLGVRPEPMHRLTGLYVAAQFSRRSITESHRDAAAVALETSLAELRAAATTRGGASPRARAPTSPHEVPT